MDMILTSLIFVSQLLASEPALNSAQQTNEESPNTTAAEQITANGAQNSAEDSDSGVTPTRETRYAPVPTQDASALMNLENLWDQLIEESEDHDSSSDDIRIPFRSGDA